VERYKARLVAKDLLKKKGLTLKRLFLQFHQKTLLGQL